MIKLSFQEKEHLNDLIAKKLRNLTTLEFEEYETLKRKEKGIILGDKL